MSWLPGQLLDRNTAITSTILADTVAKADLHEGHRLWPHIHGWAAELGLTVSDAITPVPPSRPATSTATRNQQAHNNLTDKQLANRSTARKERRPSPRLLGGYDACVVPRCCSASAERSVP